MYIFNTLSVRLLTLIGISDVIVFFPGGFGTMDETFSLLERISLKMMKCIPVYFYGSEFWNGLKQWLKESVASIGAISREDLELIKIETDINNIANDIILYLGR